MVLEVVSASALAAAGVLAYGVGGRSSQLFGPSVHRGPRQKRAIALTFDDGPSESTPELLQVLAEYGVHATFFQCGASVRRLPEVARQVAAGGHEIGNHGDSHTRLFLRMPGFVEEQVARAQETIREVTGVEPRLFRAPYGGRWFGLRSAQRRWGLTGVMWTCISMDWAWPAGRVVQRLLAAATNGAIFCLHDGRETRPNPDIRNTIEAVRQFLKELPPGKFRFETVSQLLSATESDGAA